MNGVVPDIPEANAHVRLFPEDTEGPTRVETLVLGGGVAGLRAAVEAARAGRVLLVTKDALTESTTGYAQGGVAAVLAEDDSLDAHRMDTIQAGGGLCEDLTVQTVVGEGQDRILELVEWGGAFDQDGDRLRLAREGGHSRARVVHAHGDATGLEVQKTLLGRVKAESRVEVWSYAFAVDLLVEEGRCVGAVILREPGRPQVILARATILCTGGAGQIYRETTNPDIATGDGMAMAWRAGLEVGDLEFVQFHPTTLYMAGSARKLITEAVRGEGGRLVDGRGERFTYRYHPDGELAPRDVVSRAIVQHLRATGESCVYLDLTGLGSRARTRFPGLNRLCSLYELDITKDLIPVHPSAHYMVGGVLTDLHGATSMPGLYAAGEVALSGLHGANRLASNSLLEGLVFGQRAGAHAASLEGPIPSRAHLEPRRRRRDRTVIHAPDMLNSIQSLMWRNAGVLRRADGLEAAGRTLDAWSDYAEKVAFPDGPGLELLNVLTVARLVVAGALWRRESRGTHTRLDHPETDDRRFRCHSVQVRGGDVVARPLR